MMIAFLGFGLSDLTQAKPIKIRVRIIPGIRAQGCTGAGICNIIIDVEFKAYKMEEGDFKDFASKEGLDALAYIDESDGRFSIDFLTAGLDPMQIESILKNDEYKMEEDFPVPFNVMLALGITNSIDLQGASNYIIKKGTYPVIRQDDRITVKFDKL